MKTDEERHNNKQINGHTLGYDIKLVFTDMDGTALVGPSTVTERTQKAFSEMRKKDIIPVVCTGRMGVMCGNALRELSAEEYLVASNGQEIYENYVTGKMFYEGYFDIETNRAIWDYLYGKNVYFQIYASDVSYVPEDREHLIDSSGWDSRHIEFFRRMQNVRTDLRDCMDRRIIKPCKYIVVVPSEEEREIVKEEMSQIHDIAIYHSGGPVLEILPASADKKKGVRMIREHFGLAKEQVMVIGDSENDLGMFEEAGVRIAMGNACDELKAKADYIAPSNHEDGVAYIIERLLLNR